MSSEASNASSAGSTAEPFFALTVDDDYIREVVGVNVSSIDIREDSIEGNLWEAAEALVSSIEWDGIIDATMVRLTASRDRLRKVIRGHVSQGRKLFGNDDFCDLFDHSGFIDGVWDLFENDLLFSSG